MVKKEENFRRKREINNSCRGGEVGSWAVDSRSLGVDGAAEFFDHLSDLLMRPRSEKDLGNPGCARVNKLLSWTRSLTIACDYL